MKSMIGLLMLCATIASAAPNFVVFIADDQDKAFCAGYGADWMNTPTLTRLMREGLVFDNAYTSTAMCGPSRAALWTSLQPHRNGSHMQRTKVRPGIPTVSDHMGAIGYRVGAMGKTGTGHATQVPVETFKMGHYGAALDALKSDPFLLIVGSAQPHLPHQSGAYKADEIEVPPFLPDAPLAREQMADYCTDINLLDAQIGATVAALEERDMIENTIFIYTSDHGAPLPFGKWTCYESGLCVPFVVWAPGRIQPGRTSAMINFVDVVPTMMDLANGAAPKGIDGRSFKSVLTDPSKAHRDVLMGTHSNEKVQMSKGAYSIRSIRDERWKLILNLDHDKAFSNNITTHQKAKFGRIMDGWKAAAEKDDVLAARYALYVSRPEVEFFDLNSDPHELQNLASDPAYAKRMASMQTRLVAWMKQQGDARLADVTSPQMK